MPDIGHISLILALLASVFSAFTFVFGYRWRSPQLLATARVGLFAACGLFTVASVRLLVALLTHDFQLEYVASYTDRGLGLGTSDRQLDPERRPLPQPVTRGQDATALELHQAPRNGETEPEPAARAGDAGGGRRPAESARRRTEETRPECRPRCPRR